MIILILQPFALKIVKFGSGIVLMGYFQFLELLKYLQRIVITMQQNKGVKKCRKIGPYILLRQIGKGSYSVVYEGRLGAEGALYAVKQISLQNLSDKQLQRIHQQVNVLSIIKHKNIIELVDFKQTSRNLYLVFQYCKFTDLNVYIQKHFNGILPEHQVRKILIQLKGAFRVIRQHRIVHRDLKLANILVTQDFEIKLADFGFAKAHQHNQYMKSAVGTPLTMAPEILEQKQYNQKCDIWSLGVITYQMLFGCNPFFKSQKLTLKEIKESFKRPLEFPTQISAQAMDFIRRMLTRDHEMRMSFQEFFEHAWLRETQEVSNLSQIMRGQALKCELTRSLHKSNRCLQEKEFIMDNCQSILTYCFIEFIKNYIENNITSWINLAKHIIDQQYPNRRLTFIALALLLENIDKTISSTYSILINANKLIQIPKYMELRNLQTWEMSEYTMRLPNFISKGKTTIEQFLKKESSTLTSMKQQGNQKLSCLLVKELKEQIGKQKEGSEMKIFLRVKPWSGRRICINIESMILTEPALNILIRNLSLKLKYDALCKRCSNMFKLFIVNELTTLQMQLQQLRLRIVESQSIIF